MTGLAVRPWSTLQAGISPAYFFAGGLCMRELSIFIDESGDFGPYEAHSPFYLLSLVFHDQSRDITDSLDKIHDALEERGLPAYHAIHKGYFKMIDRKRFSA